MAKNARPIPGSRAESLLDQLLTEVKGLRADLRVRDETRFLLSSAEVAEPVEYDPTLVVERARSG